MGPSVAHEWVAQLDPSTRPLTSAVSHHVHAHLADTLAVALAARRSPDFAPVMAGTLRGASGACGLLADGRTAPPAQAAFLNATAAHLMDFDDIHDDARLHPTPVVLGAALAAGQLARTPGRALVYAIGAGCELMCRLGVALRPMGSGLVSHWFTTQLLGYAGSALAAGLTLGLDEPSLVHAIGLSTMQAAGAKQVGNGVGSNARAIYPGFAAAGGLTAALLAAEGMQGPSQAIEGVDGFLASYLGSPDVDLEWGSAQSWSYQQTAIKPWPCCRISHPCVSAALAARRSLFGRPLSDVRAILVEVNPSAAKLCAPENERRAPMTISDAKYSIPFMSALALVHGAVDLHLTGSACLQDTAVLAMAHLVRTEVTFADRPGHPQARITLHLADGDRIIAGPNRADLDLNDADALSAKIAQCLQAPGDQDEVGASFLAAVTAAVDDERAGAADRLLDLAAVKRCTTA